MCVIYSPHSDLVAAGRQAQGRRTAADGEQLAYYHHQQQPQHGGGAGMTENVKNRTPDLISNPLSPRSQQHLHQERPIMQVL